MRGIEGYDVAAGRFTEEQRNKLDKIIANSPDKVCNAIVSKNYDNNDIHIMRLGDDPIHIWGLGLRTDPDTYATIWGSDEHQMVAAMVDMDIKEFFPYNVVKNQVYLVRNAMAYESNIKKGKKVKTPKGEGRVWCVDESVCVELDDDNSILHEFDLGEIEVVKGQ